MDILLDVVKVAVEPDYKLLLEFENGEMRVFDMAPYMDKKPFAALKGSPLFAKASVDYGTVVWPGTISTSHRKHSTTAPDQPNSPFAASLNYRFICV